MNEIPDYSAGSASIRIGVDFRNFDRDLHSELEAREVKFNVGIKPDFKDLDDLQARLNAISIARDWHINVAVRANTSDATAEVDTWRREQDAKPAIRQRVVVDQSSASKAKKDAEKIGSELAKAGKLNLGVVAISGVPGVLAGLASIGEAAVQAAHAVAGIGPALGFAGLTGVAGIAVGISGIASTFKDMSAASTDAAGNAQKLVDAQNAVAEAQYKVGDAQRAVQTADREMLQDQQNLNDAYRDASRELRDMNESLDEQKLNVSDAAIAVNEAAKRLQEVQHDPRADADARQQAENDYQRTIIRLQQQKDKQSDLSQDAAKANALGVDGSKKVTDAKQKVADAAQNEANTVHNLQQSYVELSKAQAALTTEKAGGSAGTKLAADLAKLSPNAKEFVNDIKGIGPAWTDLRKSTSDALFDGLGTSVQTLATAQLPNLKTGLTNVDSAINTGLKATLKELSSSVNQADFKTALSNVATGFQNAAKGAGPLTDALTKLVTTGSSFLPRLGDDFAHMADRFDAFIQKASADGSLKRWIDNGLTAVKELFQTIEHIGSSIGSVFKAAGTDGVKSLDDLTGKLADFLKSTEGQGELRAFFSDARAEMEKWKPILADLPGIIKGVADGVRTWSEVTMPFLGAAAALLRDHPQLVETVIVAYLAFKTLGPIFDAVKSSIRNIGTALSNTATEIANQQMWNELRGSGRVGGSVSALGGLLSATGPLGIGALALGVGAGLTYLIGRHNDAAAAADAQRQKEEALQNTLDKASGKVTQDTLDAASADLQKRGFLDRASSFGIDKNAFVRAATGVSPVDKDAINRQVTQEILKNKGSAGTAWRDAVQATHLSDADIAQALQGIPEAVKKYTDALKKTKDQVSAAGGDTSQLPDLSDLKSRLNDTGESAASLGGEMNDVASSAAKMGQAQRDAFEGAHGSFALTSSAADGFKTLGIAVQQVPDAKTVIINAPTATQKKALDDLKYQTETLPDGSVKINLDDAQAQAGIQQIVHTPWETNVQVKWVFSQVDLSVAARHALNPGSGDTTTITGGSVGGRAAGGPIEGGVPGKDSVPILGMPGEHMLTTSDVDKLGGQAGVYRFRSALQRGDVARYADGGAVGEGPQPAQIGPNGIVYPDQQNQGSSKARLAAQAVETFAQGRNGQPYGGSEDCSGFISELADIAVGLAPGSGRMSTANEGEWLSAIGFQIGSGPPGSFRVGWINDPNMAAGGHTAGTLPNEVNVESGGASSKVMYGGAAIGAGNSLFTQHAYLVMGTGAGLGGATPGGVWTGTSAAPGGATGTSSVVYPQAPLPGARSDEQIQQLSDRAAVDDANSQRNAVYANPASTAEEKLAADIKYQQAQNALQKSKGGLPQEYSLPGIASKGAGILAQGLLDSFGLGNSILSGSNPYNQALNTTLNFYGQSNPTLGGYSYVPQNLPSIATTSTDQSSANTSSAAHAGAVPGATAGGQPLSIDPSLGNAGSIIINQGGSGGPGGPTGSSGAGGSVVGAVKSAVAPLGWNQGSEWDSLDRLITHESSWNPTASAEPASDAYGLFQFLSTTWASVGASKTDDPYQQAVAGAKYIQSKYSDPIGAWAFEMSHTPNWYDDGGIASGTGFMLKNIIRPERVLNPQNTETFDSVLPLLDSINSSQSWWNGGSNAVQQLPQGQQNSSNVGHDYSTHIHEPRLASVEDLANLVERNADRRAIGLSAAL